jgi:hypothetical protein
MAADRRNRSTLRPDPQRGDHMNPYGKTRGAITVYWIVAALLAIAALAVLIY